MEHRHTVTIEPIKDHPNALRLNWERWVVEADVRPTFHELTHYLDEAFAPVNVLVDLTSDPRLPLQTTISETISGPFMHPNMGMWLVVGTNQRAQIVANVITLVGLRDSIRWFESEAEALAFLDQLEGRLVPAWE
jgi:hypothetical protein